MRTIKAAAAAIPFVAAAALFSCAQDNGSADAGKDGGKDAGVDAGCRSAGECSSEATLTAICTAGDCQDLPQTKSRINYLKLSFSQTGKELYGKTASFKYFAIHPSAVSGATVSCKDMLSAGVDPLSGAYNVIQKYAMPLTDVYSDMMTSTLDMPDVTGLVMLLHIMDSGNNLIGMGCEGKIDMPVTPSDRTIGVYICPVGKLGPCISSGG